MEALDYKLRARLNTGFKSVKFRIKGRPHYQIYLDIISDNDPTLKEIIYVKYQLHKSFKNRERISNERSNNFKIEIKAWGTFVVQITLGLANGKTYEFSHDLGKGLIRTEM